MKRNKPFSTLAEAIEAGEPPLVDKITGEYAEGKKSFVWLYIQGDILITEKVFNTLSGNFVIIARYKTPDEKEAEKRARQKEKKDEIKALRKHIGAIMALPGYILIAWANPFKPDNNHFNRLFYPKTHAYYLPETGPRYVYHREYELTYEKDKRGIDSIMTAKAPGAGWGRWCRREIADTLKTRPDDYILCAPLWLLTSIPDPRPRFLTGEE